MLWLLYYFFTAMGQQEINIAVPQIVPQGDPLRLTYEGHHLLCPLRWGGLGLGHIPIQRHEELHLLQIQVRLVIFFDTVFCIFLWGEICNHIFVPLYNLFCRMSMRITLMLWVRIPLRQGVLDTTLCDKSLSVTCGRSGAFSSFLYL